MKTKLLLVSGMLFSFLTLFGQVSQTPEELRAKIDHFPAYTRNLQKQQLTNYERLDSIVVANYNSATNSFTLNNLNVYLYDNNNLNTVDDYRTWDAANSTMQILATNLYDYNTNGFLQSQSSYYLSSGTMIPSYKAEFVYNPQYQLIEEISYNWDSTGNAWVYASKEVYTYATTSSSSPVFVMNYNWDSVANAWVNSMRAVIVYNTNADVQSMQIDTWDTTNNAWLQNSLMTRTYTSAHKLQEEVQQNWDVTNNVWINGFKKNYTYTPNGSGEDIFYLSQTWDAINVTWKDANKAMISVDANNEITFSEYYYMDANTGNWVGTVKMMYTYNATQVIMERTMWDYNNTSWHAGPTYKNVYEYDMNFSTNDLILPNSYNPLSVYNSIFINVIPYYNTMRNKLLDITTYNKTNPADPWLLSMKQNYKYTSQTAAVAKEDYLEANIFPNPFVHSLSFEVDAVDFDLQVFDLSGKKLYHNKHHQGDLINLNFLKKGMYLYRLQAGKKLHSGKLIKK